MSYNEEYLKTLDKENLIKLVRDLQNENRKLKLERPTRFIGNEPIMIGNYNSPSPVIVGP